MRKRSPPVLLLGDVPRGALEERAPNEAWRCGSAPLLMPPPKQSPSEEDKSPRRSQPCCSTRQTFCGLREKKYTKFGAGEVRETAARALGARGARAGSPRGTSCFKASIPSRMSHGKRLSESCLNVLTTLSAGERKVLSEIVVLQS